MTDAILLFDKPPGITSQQAVTKVKRLFQVKKAGHTGTLDPFATGLLPICLGQATKYADFFLQADKHYLATVQLGTCSTTGDTEGEFTTCLDYVAPTEQAVRDVLMSLLGKQQQYPPRYAAIKYQGKPLYYYARKGIKVTLTPREVTINELQLVKYQDTTLSLAIHCSKGTYVRSIVEQIGLKLGCGAYTQSLRRLGVGELAGLPMWDLSSLQAIVDREGVAGLRATIISIDDGLSNFPAVTLDQDNLQAIQQGKMLNMPQMDSAKVVRLHDQQRVFWGLGQSDGQLLRALRLMAVTKHSS